MESDTYVEQVDQMKAACKQVTAAARNNTMTSLLQVWTKIF